MIDRLPIVRLLVVFSLGKYLNLLSLSSAKSESTSKSPVSYIYVDSRGCILKETSFYQPPELVQIYLKRHSRFGKRVRQHPQPRRQDTLNIKSQDDIDSVNNKVFARGKCKYCNSVDVVKNGKQNGYQKYWCKDCNRKFLDNDKFPKMKTDKNIMAIALDLYFNGLSLRKVKRMLKKIYGKTVNESTIWRWIDKYSPMVKGFTDALEPNVNNRWHADETGIHVKGELAWWWGIIDRDTKYLVESHVGGRTRKDAHKLFSRAKRAHGVPRVIYHDGLRSYDAVREVMFNDITDEVELSVRDDIGIRSPVNNNPIERLNSTLKQRLKVMRGLQNPQALLDMWQVHYNYMRPHQTLGGRTPAQASGLELPMNPNNGWGDLIKWSIHHHSSRRKEIVFMKDGKVIKRVWRNEFDA